MTKRNGVRYTKERKAEIIHRMMPPENESVAQIAKEEGITSVRRKEARVAGSVTPGNGQTSDKWRSHDKFLIVMDTFAMNELEIAEYCRKKGLYREQIEAWRNVCLQANAQSFDQAKQLNGELKDEQQRAKKLEKDLRKKENSASTVTRQTKTRKKA